MVETGRLPCGTVQREARLSASQSYQQNLGPRSHPWPLWFVGGCSRLARLATDGPNPDIPPSEAFSPIFRGVASTDSRSRFRGPSCSLNVHYPGLLSQRSLIALRQELLANRIAASRSRKVSRASPALGSGRLSAKARRSPALWTYGLRLGSVTFTGRWQRYLRTLR